MLLETLEHISDNENFRMKLECFVDKLRNIFRLAMILSDDICFKITCQYIHICQSRVVYVMFTLKGTVLPD